MSEMSKLIPVTKALKQGIYEEYEWYTQYPEAVSKRGYIDFINKNFTRH